MISVIICEGKIDVQLIGYYLRSVYGLTYVANPKIKIKIRDQKEHNKDILWLTDKDTIHEIAVWGAGGIRNIQNALKSVVERNFNEPTSEKRIKNIVVFFDRDDKDEQQCTNRVNSWVKNAKIIASQKISIGSWATVNITLKNAKKFEIQFLSILVPPDREGALEEFLIHALKEEDTDKALVDSAIKFIADQPDEPYLKKKRYRPKAILGAIISVMYPYRGMEAVDKKLLLVKWENLSRINNSLSNLNKLVAN